MRLDGPKKQETWVMLSMLRNPITRTIEYLNFLQNWSRSSAFLFAGCILGRILFYCQSFANTLPCLHFHWKTDLKAICGIRPICHHWYNWSRWSSSAIFHMHIPSCHNVATLGPDNFIFTFWLYLWSWMRCAYSLPCSVYIALFSPAFCTTTYLSLLTSWDRWRHRFYRQIQLLQDPFDIITRSNCTMLLSHSTLK